MCFPAGCVRAVCGQVEEELQEQEFLDRCFQEMLEEEEQDWFIPARDLPQGMAQLQQQLHGLSVGDGSDDILVRSPAILELSHSWDPPVPGSIPWDCPIPGIVPSLELSHPWKCPFFEIVKS